MSILLRKITPFSENINKVAHASMCVSFLSAAADVVDFLEYSNNTHILEKIGVNSIFGKKSF